jgi:succinate-semialdehyde dehydrogenase/glutarate-semialdehyde dehydrogenase
MRAPVALDRPDLLREHAFIGGAWVDAAQRIVVDNPAKGTIIGSVPDLGADKARDAVRAAARAFPGGAPIRPRNAGRCCAAGMI